MLQYLVRVHDVEPTLLYAIQTLPVEDITDLEAHIRDAFLFRMLARLLDHGGGGVDGVDEAGGDAGGEVDGDGAGAAADIEDLQVWYKVGDQVRG